MAIDLYCGLGGWAEGLLAEGWRVIGYDIEAHRYPRRDVMLTSGPTKSMHGTGSRGSTLMQEVGERAYRNAAPIGGWDEYPGELILQDVLTLHGSQFKDAQLIVASPPCTEYSYMAMPWSRAKQIAAALEGRGEFPTDYKGSRTIEQLNALFDACFRIQREASEAAGRYIPMIVENVRGAVKWVSQPCKWHFGSYYLWGDVPALMPITIMRFHNLWLRDPNRAGGKYAPDYTKTLAHANKCDGTKQDAVGVLEVDQPKRASDSFDWKQESVLRQLSSRSSARKAASAQIAKIPYSLASHIARVFQS